MPLLLPLSFPISEKPFDSCRFLNLVDGKRQGPLATRKRVTPTNPNNLYMMYSPGQTTITEKSENARQLNTATSRLPDTAMKPTAYRKEESQKPTKPLVIFIERTLP